MTWWYTVCSNVRTGDVIYTPGEGLDGGNKKRPFTIFSKDDSKIVIESGRSKVPLPKQCFDIAENALVNKMYPWLRGAALHGNEPAKNSLDELLRQATKSQLARGNYVCALLERCGLVKYSMQGRRKVIELP